MKKIAFVFPGMLPIPPVRGGAVENLIYNLVKENEIYKKEKFLIYSVYDEMAFKTSEKETEFFFIKIPYFIHCADRICFWLAKYVLRKENIHSYKSIFLRLYYLWKVSNSLKKRNDIEKIILENHPTTYLALKWNGNFEKYKGNFYYHAHNEIKSSFGCGKIIQSTKAFLCVSQYIANQLAGFWGIKDKNKIRILKNAIDTDRFQKCNNSEKISFYRDKYGIKYGEKVVLFVGRIVPEKGIKEAILGFKRADLKNTKLLIVGGVFFGNGVKSRFEEELEKISENIRNKIIFSGFVPYEDMPYIYRIANVVLLPSKWEDPAPLTVIESIVADIPLITTKSGGIPEYVEHTQCVLLSKNSDIINNISIALKNLLTNEARDLKKRNKDMLNKYSEFSLRRYYDDFINLISNDT